MLHGYHGVVNAEVHQRHGPVFELPRFNLTKVDDLGLAMPVVSNDASVKIVDNAALTLEYLHIQTFALTQHASEVVRLVIGPCCFQNLGGDGGGLRTDRSADIDQTCKHEGQSMGFL